LCITL
jgi:type II secretory pathway component PulJ